MNTHDKLEAVLNTDEQLLSIINIEIEFSLNCIMDQNACFNADFVIFRLPVGLVGDWNTVPSVWINVSESFTDASNDSLGKNMRLLVEMMMVSIWVIESSYLWLNKHKWLLDLIVISS